MARFPKYTLGTAPEGAKGALESAEKEFGMIPNLEAYMADSPPLLKAYGSLWGLFHEESAFDPVEQQVISLTTSYENNCEYCVSGHSHLAGKAGMDDATLDALREGQPLADARLEALRRFVSKLTTRRGAVSRADVDEFLAAGYSERHVLDAILGVALKTISNYTNHIVGTPLDSHIQASAWKKRVA